MEGLAPAAADTVLMALWGVGIYLLGWLLFRRLREPLLQRL